MAEMTLEERVTRLEAHLGIGDSEGAKETRKKALDRKVENLRDFAGLNYLLNIHQPDASKRLKEEMAAINSLVVNDRDEEACSPSSVQIDA